MQAYVSDSDGLEMARTAKWFIALAILFVLVLPTVAFLLICDDIARDMWWEFLRVVSL